MLATKEWLSMTSPTPTSPWSLITVMNDSHQKINDSTHFSRTWRTSHASQLIIIDSVHEKPKRRGRRGKADFERLSCEQENCRTDVRCEKNHDTVLLYIAWSNSKIQATQNARLWCESDRLFVTCDVASSPSSRVGVPQNGTTQLWGISPFPRLIRAFD